MTSHKDESQELEKAVQVLLKPPHVYYLRELNAAARTDPAYIFNNEATVCTDIQQILAREGIQWKPDFLKRQWQKVLGIAMHRLKAA
ncbi:MAG: hypothetical protein HBSIN02_18810 [Bacteroidia bacterium]|nr:MAG: hypothetical protein HBSIN02_18810 [Bacteroidia bacterium]